MPLQTCPEELIALACRLADEGSEVARRYFRTSFAVEGKADLSPVTIADRKGEQVMRVFVAQHRPDDGVIGEEFGNERADAEFVWVLDPIDGTRAYVAGKPIFGTLVALLHEGTPILGVIDQPITGERWVGAAGHPTKFNGTICKTRDCTSLSQAVVSMGAQAFPFGNAVSLDAYRRVAKHALTTTVGGDCYSYGLIASGCVDMVIEHALNLYDYAALVPVVEGAGGVMRDWQGKHLTRESDGHVLAVSSVNLLHETVALLEGAL